MSALNPDGQRLFEITGGELCLDFANTVDNRPSRQRRELIPTYHDLMDWGKQTGLLSSTAAKRLSDEAARSPKKANQLLRRARKLREDLFQIFSAIADGRRPRLQNFETLKPLLTVLMEKR